MQSMKRNGDSTKKLVGVQHQRWTVVI